MNVQQLQETKSSSALEVSISTNVPEQELYQSTNLNSLPVVKSLEVCSTSLPNSNGEVNLSPRSPKMAQSLQLSTTKTSASLISEATYQWILRSKIAIFASTYIAYAVIHATRTAWSSSKQSLKEELDEENSSFLGLVDTCFLLVYAVSMKTISGMLAGKVPINHILGFGMISASVCLLTIYFICEISISKPFILVMMVLNGVSQSTGWPSVVACMGNWFGSGQKGLLMGLWGTSGNFGNMMGYFIQDFAVNSLELNWKFVLFFVGVLLLIVGSLIVFQLEPYPMNIGITDEQLIAFEQDLKQRSFFSFTSHNGKHVELRDERQLPVNNHSQAEHQSNLNPSFWELRNQTVHLQKINYTSAQQKDDEEKEKQGMECSVSNRKPKTDDDPGQGEPIQINNDQGQEEQLQESSQKVNDDSSSHQQQNMDSQIELLPNSSSRSKITFLNAWVRIPGLTGYALTMGGVKSTVYGIMFWMPIYLQERGLKSEAALICSMNEIGTFVGGLLLGSLLDRFPFKGLFISAFLLTSSVLLFIIHYLPLGIAGPYYFFVLLTGIALGGPYSLLGGAIAIDLAQQEEVKDEKDITAMLAGMIEGFGAFVAAFVQMIIPLCGQDNIFVLFMLTSLLSSFCLIKKARAELTMFLNNNN